MPARKPRLKCAYPPCTRPRARARSKYCRRRCFTLDRLGKRRDTSAAIKANRLRYARRVIRVIVADCRPHLDANRRMPLDQVVRVVLKHSRVAYARGYAANYLRRRRAPQPVVQTGHYMLPGVLSR